MRQQRQHWSLNEVQTKTVPGGGPEPGELLYTVGPDRRRIGLDMLIRLGVSALAGVLAALQGADLQKPGAAAAAALLAVTLLLIVLWPLRHWRDGMELRRGGVIYRGKFYPVSGRVTWVGTRNGFLDSTYLGLGGKRRINVSFMKDAEKLFARAYDNTI